MGRAISRNRQCQVVISKSRREKKRGTNRLLRKPREREQKQRPNQHRHRALDNKNPPPPLIPSHSIHLSNGARQQAPKSPRQAGRAKKQRKPLLSLPPPVPRPNHIKTPGKHDALTHPEEKPRRQQSAKVPTKPLTHGHDTKADATCTQPHPRTEFFQEDIGGHLEQDVGDEEDGQRGVVVVAACHVEVGLEAEGSRVGDVDTVEKGQEVEGYDEGEDVGVDTEG